MDDQGATGADRRIDRRRTAHRPGSRGSRLVEAGKQLDLVLEDVDLDAEPALAEALTDAVAAVERARRLEAGSGEPRRAEGRIVGTADGRTAGGRPAPGLRSP